MAHAIPASSNYQGLARTVLEYSEKFQALVKRLKQPDWSAADWAPLEALVDVANFRREGIFLGSNSEVLDWPRYKDTISQYGGLTQWEGTLRRITEVPGLVYLELEERNTRNGVVDIAHTVTIYQFNAAGKLSKLDVYVSHVGQRPAV